MNASLVALNSAKRASPNPGIAFASPVSRLTPYCTTMTRVPTLTRW
jgi:hypothetical protein